MDNNKRNIKTLFLQGVEQPWRSTHTKEIQTQQKHTTHTHNTTDIITKQMTSIDWLQVQGIRSFNPNKKAAIKFNKPLTIILGSNGAGKTVRCDSTYFIIFITGSKAVSTRWKTQCLMLTFLPSDHH